MEISDIKDWKIVKSDLLTLENESYIELLFEDMFQIRKKDYVIDSGWYASQNAFVTYLIYMHNWECPMAEIVSSSLEGCLDAISQLMNYAESEMINRK